MRPAMPVAAPAPATPALHPEAIPSRSNPAVTLAAHPAPMFEVGTVHAPKRVKASKPPKKVKPVKKTKKPQIQIVQRAARTSGRKLIAPKPAKNPNRPLEMKNQLTAVLAMTRELSKVELALFAQSMEALQGLSKKGRRRVIDALARVYA